MARSRCRQISTVQASQAWHDDAEQAEGLWDQGFRPMHAHDIRSKDELCYVQTFGPAPFGPIATTNVEEVVEHEFGGMLLVSTYERGVVEVDECTEVWVRRQVTVCH